MLVTVLNTDVPNPVLNTLDEKLITLTEPELLVIKLLEPALVAMDDRGVATDDDREDDKLEDACLVVRVEVDDDLKGLQTGKRETMYEFE
ncbi:hypothetical protein N0V90_010445 [Kalmusia sp. IMI 367209]|nr:hypothetical protein N0V90_010445 [Kalmusia sp. IMI 367209]